MVPAASTLQRWRGEIPRRLVAEVGFTDKKATGATVVVDNGGPVDTTTDVFPGYGELSPQMQSVPPCDPAAVPADTDCTYTGGTSRTETGQVLTQAFQGFLGHSALNFQVGRFQIPVGETYLRYSQGEASKPFMTHPVGGPWGRSVGGRRLLPNRHPIGRPRLHRRPDLRRRRH